MKSKWEFYFEVHGFHFERKHKFKGVLNDEHHRAFNLPMNIRDFFIEIEPDAECKFPRAEQSGKFRILLQGDHTETKAGAHALALSLAHQISFTHQGQFTIHSGLVTCERIAETTEDQEIVAEHPFVAEVRLIECTPPVKFDPISVQNLKIGGSTSAAVRQFNAATQATNAIDRMIGFFKVLESLYFDKGRQNEIAVLRKSDELREVADTLARTNGWTATDEDYDQLLRDLVRTRGHCAHLRAHGMNGFVPGTTQVISEVEPIAEIAKKLAFGAIQLRLERESNHQQVSGL